MKVNQLWPAAHKWELAKIAKIPVRKTTFIAVRFYIFNDWLISLFQKSGNIPTTGC